MSAPISCFCGYTSQSIKDVLAHQDASHPERRAQRIEALQGLRQALAPAKTPAHLPNDNK